MAKELVKTSRNKVVHKYILEPYTGRNSRHTCPNCRKNHSYTRFIDVTTGEYLSEEFGRCNRTEKCGYFNSPYGKNILDNKIMVSKEEVLEKFQSVESTDTSIISPATIIKSMTLKDNFSTYLINHFGPRAVEFLLKYKVGESDKWEGATVFWQIDKDYDTRTGKIMLYDENCKRVKEPYNKVSWAHCQDKGLNFTYDYNLKQCLFGEHLINDEIEEYHIVEAEKTAIICNIASPDKIWLAVGGLEMINPERLEVLSGSKMIFYPDKGEKAFDKWKSKLESLGGDFDYEINRGIEKISSLKDGDDLADYILNK